MLTQDEYQLYTGKTSKLSDENWGNIVELAALRLAGLLCLDALPEPLPADLKLLLANFIYLMLEMRGDKAPVTSKKVRNFTINYGNDTSSAFAKLNERYADIIGKYSACGSGFAVEKSTRCCNGCF